MLNKPQKILFLITKSNYGGAQKYVFELAVAAQASGCEVLVAFGGTGEAGATTGVLKQKLDATNIKSVKIDNFRRNMSLLGDFLAFIEVWRLLRKVKPDTLHASSSKAGGIGVAAGRLAGTKNIIFTSHGLTIDETWRPKWQRILIYIGTWLTIKLSHQSIMISTETFNRARSMPKLASKVTLIKNGIAPTELLSKPTARKELAPDVPQRSIWIGGIGELHSNKNWASAIKAMPALPQSTHLVIIGEGEQRGRLENLIKKSNLENRVHLLGFVDGAKYLKAYDIYLLPSLKEGLPYVLLEAGLAELPVVASDLPGIRDIVESGQSGLLVKPTPDLLATTLQMLIRDEGMRRRFGANLNRKVFTEFSISEMVEKTFKIYESNKSDAL